MQKATWTRELGKDKPIVDYVIIVKKYFTIIKGMCIDQNKEYATFKIQKRKWRYNKYIFRS